MVILLVIMDKWNLKKNRIKDIKKQSFATSLFYIFGNGLDFFSHLCTELVFTGFTGSTYLILNLTKLSGGPTRFSRLFAVPKAVLISREVKPYNRLSVIRGKTAAEHHSKPVNQVKTVKSQKTFINAVKTISLPYGTISNDW